MLSVTHRNGPSAWEPAFELRMRLDPAYMRSPQAEAFRTYFCMFWNSQMSDAWECTFDADGALMTRQKEAGHGMAGYAPWHMYAALQRFLQEEIQMPGVHVPEETVSDDPGESMRGRERQMRELWDWIFDNWDRLPPYLKEYGKYLQKLEGMRAPIETTKSNFVRLAINKAINAERERHRNGIDAVLDVHRPPKKTLPRI